MAVRPVSYEDLIQDRWKSFRRRKTLSTGFMRQKRVKKRRPGTATHVLSAQGKGDEGAHLTAVNQKKKKRGRGTAHQDLLVTREGGRSATGSVFQNGKGIAKLRLGTYKLRKGHTRPFLQRGKSPGRLATTVGGDLTITILTVREKQTQLRRPWSSDLKNPKEGGRVGHVGEKKEKTIGST